MTSDIMEINRLRMASDGDGVSTLIVMFDCPLECRYCINESCHEDTENRTLRAAYEPVELLERLKKDDIYYKMTGGGIVFGGGEPLLQAEFIHEVCAIVDPAWKKRIETSLYAPWKYIQILLQDMDEWIIDIKDMNPEIYREYTGCSNEKVLDNLQMLLQEVPAEKIRVRVPHIVNYNTAEDVEKSIQQLRDMGFARIDEFAYFETESRGHHKRPPKKVTCESSITIPDFLRVDDS